MNFAELLDRVASVDGDFRVRFMTSHPKDFNEDVVKVMAKHKKICKLVHLPVQSGSNKILQEMNRRYTREKYLEEVKMLRSYFPEAELTTDIIVGFPGETEEDYLQTEALVKEVGFASAFTFIYSPRTGTKAATMENQIPESVQKERIMRLVELVNSLTRQKSERYIGKKIEILCEDYDEKKGYYLGRDEYGRMPVMARGKSPLIGCGVILCEKKNRHSRFFFFVNEIRAGENLTKSFPFDIINLCTFMLLQEG